MDVYEITGFETGVSRAGVNYLQPSDSFQNIQNGFIYRQVLQSRQGVGFFSPSTPRLAGETRIFGIFEFQLADGSKKLLAFDKNFLYVFNTGSGLFDQVPFGGSMGPMGSDYGGFNISANDFYISGVSYPTKTNASRFVFCGEGIFANGAGSKIFFYDGVDVKDYTNGGMGGDNPDYTNPVAGTLTSATFVLNFNNRINFVVPVISGISYQQSMLFSGFRNADGNGDKFNIPGAGQIRADTYQVITGATILGDIIVLNFNRSAYAIDKKTDAFNPYFIRGIPGVLGTNAKFSAVSYNESVRSLGRTGVLGCDGRQNLRVDNKVPYFTADEIDQVGFKLTYGGFDRLNNQFLWSYKIAETDTDTQNSVLVSNYEEDTWSVYDQRFSVFGQTDVGLNLRWNQIDESSGNESWARWDTTEELWNRIGLGADVQKTLAGDERGFIYELNRDYDDYFTNISAVVLGVTTTLTVSAVAIKAGDLVTVSNVVGMLDADGESGINNYSTEGGEEIFPPYLVLSATATSIEINLDSRYLTAYTSGGDVSKPISFYAETIPFNPYRQEGRRCYVSHVEFLAARTGGSLTVDVFADQQETPFKRNIVLKPNSNTQGPQWMSMSVNEEANFLTFALKQTSPGAQLRLTSIRIHCSRGGETSG